MALCQPVSPVSWETVNKNKSGTITIYWEESKPFIFKNANQKMVGIEYEIMEGFKKLVFEEVGYDANLENAFDAIITQQQYLDYIQSGMFVFL